MKNNNCPFRNMCKDTDCEDCKAYSKILEQKSRVKNLEKEISRLTAENKELRARLENAVELPCKVGDTVYWIEVYEKPQRIYEYKVEGFSMTQSKENLRVILDGRWLCPVIEVYKDVYLFFDRDKAEAKLKELQGGNV